MTFLKVVLCLGSKLIKETLESIEVFLDCTLDHKICKFTEYKSFISRKIRGVYVIYDNNTIYYVGKGNIKTRQGMHVEKFLGDFKNATDTRGFKLLRENTAYNINNFDLLWIEIKSETLIGAVESVLIHKLQPIANDEVVLDKNPC